MSVAVIFVPLLTTFVQLVCGQETYVERYFTQKVDHFNFVNGETYKQRFLFTKKYWDKKGPIFFYTGNEGDILGFWRNSGFVFEAAANFSALVIFAEHRYYGKSLPFGSSSFDQDKIGYLSAEQALADYAVLMTELKVKYQAADKPVVAFGGSYGGVLAAWMRFKYPNIIDAALAASAPIYMLAHGASRDFFFKAVTNDFKRANDQCPVYVRDAFKKLEELKARGAEGLGEISKIFKLCKPLASVEQVNYLIGWIRNAFTIMAMMDYPYPTDFLAPLPAKPVNYACKLLSGAEDKLQGLAEAAGLAYNGSSAHYTGQRPGVECFDIWTEFVECADPTGCGTGNANKAWDYQACTEMLMPSGTNNVTDMFPVLPWTPEMREAYCKKRFGIEQRPSWVGTEFWGRDISTSSNIIFSNGDLDPWAPGGVMKSISPTLVAIMIKGGAHHLDLRSSNPADPASVKMAREQELDLIRKWIA